MILYAILMGINCLGKGSAKEMTTKTQRQNALQEYGKTRNIVLLQKRLGHKHIRSTLDLLVRSGALENAGGPV